MQRDALAQSFVITIKRKSITHIILCIINYVRLIRLYEMVNSLMRGYLLHIYFIPQILFLIFEDNMLLLGSSSSDLQVGLRGFGTKVRGGMDVN